MAPLLATCIWFRKRTTATLGATWILGPSTEHKERKKKGTFASEYLATHFWNSTASTENSRFLCASRSEPLESLHAEPRGLQADTSAVAVAEHCSFIDDLTSKGFAVCSPTLCETRARVETPSSCSSTDAVLLSFNTCCVLRLPLSIAVQLVNRVVLQLCIVR